MCVAVPEVFRRDVRRPRRASGPTGPRRFHGGKGRAGEAGAGARKRAGRTWAGSAIDPTGSDDLEMSFA